MNMMAEKTKEMVLTQADLLQLRKEHKPKMVCGHCGKVRDRHFHDSKVCEPCVKEAMEAEGFPYAKRIFDEV